MDTYERKAFFEELANYCHHSGDHGFVEVTLWKNGEGFDALVSGHADSRIALTWGEWECLRRLVVRADAD